jgi:hypothetical protein
MAQPEPRLSQRPMRPAVLFLRLRRNLWLLLFPGRDRRLAPAMQVAGGE